MPGGHAQPSPRDQAWLCGITDRDPAALRGLFEQYAPTALALAHRILGDRMLAEDVVQEAFLAVWEHPGGYTPERGTVRAFLLAIVHHRAVDRVRREAAQHRRTRDEARYGAAGPHPAVADTVVDAAYLTHRREQVRAALATIPAEQRRIIELMYFTGLTQRQVSEALQLPLGTVKSRTLLAMRKLRAALADSPPGGGDD